MRRVAPGAATGCDCERSGIPLLMATSSAHTASAFDRSAGLPSTGGDSRQPRMAATRQAVRALAADEVAGGQTVGRRVAPVAVNVGAVAAHIGAHVLVLGEA